MPVSPDNDPYYRLRHSAAYFQELRSHLRRQTA